MADRRPIGRKPVHELSRFGRVLDQFLQRHALTLRELAGRIGVSRQQLLRLRSGRAEGRQSTIGRIRAGLEAIEGRNISIEELFDFPRAERER